MKFLSLAPLLGFLSACAAGTPPPQEVRIVVVHAPAGAPGSTTNSDSAATPAAPPRQAPATAPAAPTVQPSPARSTQIADPWTSGPSSERPSATTPAPVETSPKAPRPTAPAARPAAITAPQAAPATLAQTGPFAGCAVRRYLTGWVEADCAEMRLLIQAGFAGKSHTGFSASVAMDRVGAVTTSSMNAFGKKTSIWIGKRRVSGRAIEIRRPTKVRHAFGVSVKRNASGEVEHRAIFAHIKTPKSGIVGVSCVASAASYNRARCIAMLNKVARHGLPGGAVKGRTVTVAGVRLPLKPKCWAPSPEGIYCLLRGGLEWKQGTHAEMGEYRKHLVKTNFGLGLEPDHKNVITERKCRVGGKDSICVRQDHWGLANYAVYTFHLAYVPDGERATVFSCRITNGADSPTPAPACQKIFKL